MLINDCFNHFSLFIVLVEQGYLRDPKFLAYLNYLLGYLSQPVYTCLLQYPNGLEILRLLTREDFRKQLMESTAAMIDFIHKQQYHHWVQHKSLQE